ncbi:MAG: glucose-1-phosphate thymidylyltransferase [Segetibacter sp.]|nr:glucose-1-phosphate thymidylyltransferase [Segetibacter sp.]
MNIVLFDTPLMEKLYPLTLTRAIADIRIGIFTIKERWEQLTNKTAYVVTNPSIQPLYKDVPSGDYLFIDATVLPTAESLRTIVNLKIGEAIRDDEGIVAGRYSITQPPVYTTKWDEIFSSPKTISTKRRLRYPHELFQWNDEYIKFDFALVSKTRFSTTPHESVYLRNVSQIFIEEETELDHCILNASAGPIYIGRNTTIMEGCQVRGPFALCEGSVLKMGTKVYGATTIGPNSVIGGEVKNSIFFGNSNKAHEGYIGDSVIGEWCNLGAGTSNSNVTNTAAEVKIWNYLHNDYIPTGAKCGVIMGDHSKTAINTSINTGTLIGVCCNVFGEGLTPKVLQNFSWGLKDTEPYEIDKALNDITNWKKMKDKTLNEPEAKMLKHLFESRKDVKKI